LRYLANDSSCVVSIRNGSSTLLLPGDISAAVESRLVQQGLPSGGILLVPHHGSKHSSSDEFLRGLTPSLALATTGVGNRFGFPRAEVRERYRDLGIPFWATDSCGAIRVLISATGSVEVLSARKERAAPWRWPAGEDCP
jgi:competence protein ComEC